jgi:DNA-binding transcriptional ArsR family regulator
VSRAEPRGVGAATGLDVALRALADGTRRTILAVVRDRPLAVGEIAGEVAVSQQAVSHHLRVLRGAGLVHEQREGTRHLFSVRSDGFDVVQAYLTDFWPTHLAALKRASERAARGGDG